MDTSSKIKSLLTDIGINPNLIEFYPPDETHRDGLSRRDVAFCHLVAKGIERDEAFRVAYSSGLGSITSLREAAYRKLKNGLIQEEMRRHINDVVPPMPVEDAEWLQHTVMVELVAMLQNQEINPANRIKAGETILRHIGMVMIELAKARPGETPRTPLEEIEKILRMENQKQLPAPDSDDMKLN